LRRPFVAVLVAVTSLLAAGEALAQKPVSQTTEYSNYEKESIKRALDAMQAEIDPNPEGKVIRRIDTMRLEVLEDRDPIPEEVLGILSLWRPTPLYRARRLEEALGTRSRIFYKYEGVSPPGSHKPNTAVAQAYYNKQEGRTRLATETGAGQWGSALSFACRLLGLECKVYMVRISYDQKPSRRSMIQTWGAELVPSPSEGTNCGRAVLAEHPDSPGSLGIAISEAVEDAAGREDTAYALGSVLNHVLLHQTVIGQEAIAQMELAGAFPDVVIGCVGGGSNFAGLAFPFLREKIAGREIDVLAC